MTDARDPIDAVPEKLADGRYVVEEVIGTGGMGFVVRALDRTLERQVAVKILADNLAADVTARTRFDREARAVARLTHPNVVRIFDMGEERGRPFLVMELIHGPSLADRVAREGRLPPEEVRRAAVDALRGLTAVHDADLLHRDMKPGNLLQDRDGTVKVADFGVALAPEATTLTSAGLVVGTLAYLAPERTGGGPATVRSDLYGLAASLRHCLIGEPPDADGASVPTTTPPGLAEFLERSLATDPAHRPASTRHALTLLRDGGATTRRHDSDHPPTMQLESDHPATAELGHDGAPAGRSDDDVAEPVSGSTRSATPRRTHRWLGALLVVAAVMAGVVLLLTGDVADIGGVEPTGDPADTARDLAEWIRDRGR